jgi:hypothetical protein
MEGAMTPRQRFAAATILLVLGAVLLIAAAVFPVASPQQADRVDYLYAYGFVMLFGGGYWLFLQARSGDPPTSG